MKEVIISCLAEFGWHKDRIVDAFSKMYETAIVPARASIWLHFDKECDQWWLNQGDFTSAGENVLATCYAIFPVGMPENEIKPKVEALVAEMDRRISGAFSVRLLRV